MKGLSLEEMLKIRAMVQAAYEAGFATAANIYMPGKGKGGKAAVRRTRIIMENMEREKASYIDELDESWRRNGVPIPTKAEMAERLLSQLETNRKSQEGGESTRDADGSVGRRQPVEDT